LIGSLEKKGGNPMKIVRVLNNNVVLSEENGAPVILTGRGIGFHGTSGQLIDESRVVQRFYPATRSEYESLRDFLTDISPEYIKLAKTIVEMAQSAWNVTFGQSSIVALADHLSFAVKRAQVGQCTPHPLQGEVSNLFPREYAMALRAVQTVRGNSMPIDDSEAVAICLHFINALAFTDGDLSRTYAMTEVFTQIFDVLESAYGHTFATGSINAARFVTHLRYFFARAASGKQCDEHPAAFVESVRDSFPRAYQVSEKVRALLEFHLGHRLTNDEQIYLTLHIERLATESETPAKKEDARRTDNAPSGNATLESRP
jgi:beta-glucoside operon transcriptional antiterminator